MSSPSAEPFSLAIHRAAEREWIKLDESLRRRFKAKFTKERLLQPRVAKDALHGVPNFYKIKITTPQFRLAYHVDDAQRLITIVAVSTRDDVYKLLVDRTLS